MNGLTIGINDQGKPILRSQFQKDLNANEKELLVAEHFISVINAAKPDVVVTLERKSDNYLSLCLKENDFLRFKYTDRTKWLSIDTTYLNLEEDDERFVAQKTRNRGTGKQRSKIYPCCRPLTNWLFRHADKRIAPYHVGKHGAGHTVRQVPSPGTQSVCSSIIADANSKCKGSVYGKKKERTSTAGSHSCHLCQVFIKLAKRRLD